MTEVRLLQSAKLQVAVLQMAGPRVRTGFFLSGRLLLSSQLLDHGRQGVARVCRFYRGRCRRI
jgi:hypothetical protein